MTAHGRIFINKKMNNKQDSHSGANRNLDITLYVIV